MGYSGRSTVDRRSCNGPTKAITGTVRGRVQGVSFRYSMQQAAVGLNVNGWVRNLPDRSVAFHAEGEAAVVDALVRWAHSGPAFARVDEVDTTRVEIAGLTMFEILS